MTDEITPPVRALAAGHVLRWRQDIPRLAPEAVATLFERYRSHSQVEHPSTVLDPCCGNGVVAAVLLVAFADQVASIEASDVDPDAVVMTSANLALLTVPEALERRLHALEQQRIATDNARLDEALRDGRRLAERPPSDGPPFRVRQANALAPESNEENRATFDLILTDPPYGRRSTWRDATGAHDGEDRTTLFLEAIVERLAPNGWIALAIDRDREPLRKGDIPDRLRVVERLDLPKRSGTLLERIG